MARMAPVPVEDCTDPELAAALGHFTKTLGFVPNSLLTMQRVPAIAAAVIALNRAVFAPDGGVDLGLKRLVAHVASTASGCQYCKAHTTVSATRHGVSDEKMAAIYEYSTSPLFSDAERVALDFAMEAASVPNAVTDESYAALAEHWDEAQIVEILGVVCMFGVFNRWNDSMATPLEEVPLARATELLGDAGWTAGKHEDRPDACQRSYAASASSTGTSPLLNSTVAPANPGRASVSATTSATSARADRPRGRAAQRRLDAAGAGVGRQPTRPQDRPGQVGPCECRVGGGLGVGVREERVVLRDTVVRPGAEVGHHHVAADARAGRRLHGADRRVAVDGVRPLRAAAARAGRPDDGVMAAQQLGDRVDVRRLDVEDPARARRRPRRRPRGPGCGPPP